MLGPEGWTMPVCEIDRRPGGAWHFGWRQPDGTEMEMRGVYRELTAPERLLTTESWGGDSDCVAPKKSAGPKSQRPSRDRTRA
jgi:uncharacterized protein YndB with AHSA1/START domain